MVNVKVEKVGEKSSLMRIVVTADKGKRLWIIPDKTTETSFEIVEMPQETPKGKEVEAK